jgi:DHA2 family multidrug resistance protein
VLGRQIVRRLQAGDIATAKAVGVPLDLFVAHGKGPVDQDTIDFVRPLVQQLALVRAINEAWLLIAVLMGLALLALPFAPRQIPPRAAAKQVSAS